MAPRTRLDVPLKFATTAGQVAKLEDVEAESGHGQSEILRACLEIALPILLEKPGMIPVCQPGVLRERP